MSVQKIFPLPVSTSGFVANISVSGNVGNVILGSGMVENVGVAVEVSFVVACLHRYLVFT